MFTRLTNPYKSLCVGSYKNYETPKNTGRMTGKTTKAVNNAVNEILVNCEINIPLKTDLTRGYNRTGKYAAIDPDWDLSYRVQEELMRKIREKILKIHKINSKWDRLTRILSI